MRHVISARKRTKNSNDSKKAYLPAAGPGPGPGPPAAAAAPSAAPPAAADDGEVGSPARCSWWSGRPQRHFGFGFPDFAHAASAAPAGTAGFSGH